MEFSHSGMQSKSPNVSTDRISKGITFAEKDSNQNASFGKNPFGGGADKNKAMDNTIMFKGNEADGEISKDNSMIKDNDNDNASFGGVSAAEEKKN